MDYGAIIAALGMLFNALQPFMPLLAPFLVALLKKAAPDIMASLPNFYKPIVSALLGTLIAYLVGKYGEGADLTSLGVGFALGGGASKFRDMATGNVNVHSDDEMCIPVDLTKNV